MIQMISFHIPEEPELLATLGEVALRHVQMNHILKMTIKTLTNLTPEEAIAATKYESSSQLRDRIKKLARKQLGEGAPLLKLQAIMTNCERLTTKRNELVHGLWAKELDGDAHIRDAYGKTRPLPKPQELKELAMELEQLTYRLNFERLEGFLKQALDQLS
jgi:hypothetical protein